MHFAYILFSTIVALPVSYAQQAADGLIVPFTSKLPACASLCGPLYDVQGKCTPPNIPTTDSSCFCTDNRITSLGGEGTSGVSVVCGTAACTSPSDLQAVKDWYTGFCQNQQASPTTAAGGTGTSTSKPTSTSKSGNQGSSGGSNNNENKTWIQGHWQWVIMIVIVVIAIIVIWVGAWLLRKRYLRKKEREFEMRPPPVAWEPTTMTGANGAAAGGNAGGHHKEASRQGKRLSKQKMRWFRPA